MFTSVITSGFLVRATFLNLAHGVVVQQVFVCRARYSPRLFTAWLVVESALVHRVACRRDRACSPLHGVCSIDLPMAPCNLNG